MPPPFDLLPALLNGLWVTAQVYIGAALFSVIVAFPAGLARLSPFLPLRWPAIAFIEVFRGTSALVQLFWFYYVLPQFGIFLDPLPVGILVLGLNYGAYGGELVRGAIRNIAPGQTEAAVALNMTPTQRMIRIILPQAVVQMLPPMGNLQIELLKNTALVSFISIADLTYQGKVLQEQSPRTLQIFGLTLILYFGFALCITGVFRGIERVMSRGLRAGGA